MFIFNFNGALFFFIKGTNLVNIFLGVYCLQCDDEKVISGLRDNTIKIWRRSDLTCSKTLTGHTGSVLCLQYDDQIIASGSSDATVRIWDVKTGAQLNTLIHHCEAVLHLRFHNGMLVTWSFF